MRFSKCPRCGDYSYEDLRTNAYCVNCNFSPMYEKTAKRFPRRVEQEEVIKKISKTIDEKIRNFFTRKEHPNKPNKTQEESNQNEN